MISITCTNCQAALSIDDAFAGGVCRCQHCGTIQTVPSRKKEGLGGTAAGLGVKTPKTLYQKRAREAGVGTGLDELADAVTSSGLSGSELSSRSARPAGAGAAPRSNLTLLIGISAIAIIALLVVILVVLKGRDPSTAAGRPSSDSGAGAGGAQAGESTAGGVGPSFAGVKLDFTTVIYVLDRGSSTAEPFGSLKQATLKSIASLGPDRRFQVIFWDNGQDQGTFPPLVAYASEAKVADVTRQLEEVYAFGATDARPALEKAIAQRPDAIVLATGKGADLDDSFVQMVKEVRKDVPVVIHTFAIGGAGQSTALKTVAQNAGGQHRDLSPSQLESSAQ